MKRTIVTLTMALVCGFAQAQTDDASTQPEAQATKRPPHMARMESELGLTDEQVQKMRQIRDSGGSMQDMRAVLTPEQKAKAAAMRSEDKGDRNARMQQHLGLSDEQMAKMAEIRKSGGSRAEMRAVLTPEQQAKFDQMRSKHEGKARASQPDPEG